MALMWLDMAAEKPYISNMAGKNQIEASKLAPLSERLDNLDAQEAEQAKSPDKAQSPLDVSVLEKLEGMDKKDLINLIRLVCDAGWCVAGRTGADLVKTSIKSRNEVYDAIKLKGATLALTATDWKEYLGLAQFWSDREFGKAVNTEPPVAQNNTMNVYGVPTDTLDGWMREWVSKQNAPQINQPSTLHIEGKFTDNN